MGYARYIIFFRFDLVRNWNKTTTGTEFEGISFRREIPATFQSLAATAQKLLPSLPAPSPFVRPAAYLLPLSRLVKMVNEAAWEDVERYSELVERCRYGGPPSVEMYREARACVERIEGVFNTIMMALNKEGGQSALSLLTSSEWTTSQGQEDDGCSSITISEKHKS
ncbi:hypothetical protein FRC11_013514 [Ceratobasidium sp. 423]|nr:hypothetical protein FRC11_013514 [Ceratobasidium sp. 423]